MNLKKHKGAEIRNIIKKSGHTLVSIAKKMNISRNTLYNHFKKTELNHYFLYKLGQIINYDFAKTFPELKASEIYSTAEEDDNIYLNKVKNQILILQEKYNDTLEKYNSLLTFLTKVANENQDNRLKREIKVFLNNRRKR